MLAEPTIELPIGRSKGFTRAALWSVLAVLLVLPLRAVFERLNFVPTAFSNRVVDYAVALIAIPVVLMAIVCVARSLQWLSLAFWPRRIGVYAAESKLILRLGPFGTRSYDPTKLEVCYPFERNEEDDGESGFEALLSEEEQRKSLLPSMFDTGTRVRIDRLILRFALGSESDLAAKLRPLLDRWQSAMRPDDQGDRH